MALNLGDPSGLRTREITPSDIKAIAITSPTGGEKLGSPILVEYTIESDKLVTAATVVCEYSSNGSDWFAATADTGNPSHSGSTSLAADADGEAYTYAWDASADLSTAFQSSTMQVRLRATDQSARASANAVTSTFEIDMLPNAPTLLSPSDSYFDAGDEVIFIWEIPTDPGSDKIAFQIEIDDNPDFSSPAIIHDSVDEVDRFQHEIDIDPGTKSGANGITYFVKDYAVTAFSAAVTFASLTNYHTGTALASSLTNPQILITNKADRRCFIDPSTITATGFTIEKSVIGTAADGLVDLLIYTGSAGAFETYWVDLNISTATAYTLGVAPFDTDELGNTIPGSITALRPLVLEGSDRGIYFSSVSSTGFTVNPADFYVDATATVRVCLRADPSEAYIDDAVSVTTVAGSSIDYDGTLDDATNGGAAWPAYLPGPVFSIGQLSDRFGVVTSYTGEDITMAKSAIGISVNGSADIHGHSEGIASLPYWTDMTTAGVPDTFEGKRARYVLDAGDALAEANYYWRVTGANIT